MDRQFSEAVYATLAAIPAGKVVSYGGLANLAGFPGRARQVGRCLKELPAGSELPWHRVVNSQRQISFPHDSAKYREQKQCLLSEGVTFNKRLISVEHFLEEFS